jgi:hypothetical protein
MILLVMLIKVAAKERVRSLIIFNLNFIVFRNSYEVLKLRCICCVLGALAC